MQLFLGEFILQTAMSKELIRFYKMKTAGQLLTHHGLTAGTLSFKKREKNGY